MAVGANLTSAAGVLSLLSEPEDEIKVFALQRLNELVDNFWAEISEDVSKIEELYENQNFPERELSALVASKVYYHLGAFQDSLLYALGAGEKFDVNGNSEYIATIISKCIDHYTALRVQEFDQLTTDRAVKMDSRLEAVVNRMFEQCLNDRRYKQAVGVALETRRIDILQRAIQESDDILDMLSYCLKVALSLISSPRFRCMVLEVLLRTYQELDIPDYISVCQCYIFLDDAGGTAQVLEKLTRGTQDDTLVAYQIAFDLYESATQHFLRRVQDEIRASLPTPPSPPTLPNERGEEEGGEKLSVPVQETGGRGKEEGEEEFSVPIQETGGREEALQEPVAMETAAGDGASGESGAGGGGGASGESGAGGGGGASGESGAGGGGGASGDGGGTSGDGGEDDEGVVMQEPIAEGEQKHNPDSGETMDVDPPGHAASSSNEVTSREPEPEPEWMGRLRSVDTILGGGKTVALHQEFLIRNNHTDLQILKNTKEGARNSVTHNVTVIANGLMHFGTTSDVFLRENLDWLKRASNWAKFTATASLGLIHYGHEKEALNLMSSYLPKDSTGSSPYAEGGGLYAIGLIHANHGLRVMDYITQELKANNSEIVRHGGCLGLGLAAMGTANLDTYDLLKENLMTRDDAVIGEAAGIAMGLVMIGTRSPLALEDMTNYARDTQHEKIQRGLALGISFLVYGHMEEADTLIEDLCRDKDPLLRRGGVFTIAMAYCGSGDNKAIKRLLHIAVSDADNDVRRAAVTSLGFILFRTSEQCPHVVSLLSESFNAHVRCGAAMALGIACAGTGSKEALSLIEPMLTDPVSFVQQAAMVAAAMILIQQSEALNSKVSFYRQHFAKIIGDKHEDTITKFGAILAQGIIDAGGRNVTISLQSRTGHMSMQTAVGLLVFSQFWFWYPLCHFLSLALTPTAVIALNADLKMPRICFRSNAKPSLYAYPPLLEKEKEKEKEKVATAVLSVTAKAKAKEKKKAAAASTAGASDVGQEVMETESSAKKDEESAEKMDTIAGTGNPAETNVGEDNQGGKLKELTEQMDTSGGNKAPGTEEAEKEGEVKDKLGERGEKKEEEEEKKGEEKKEEEKKEEEKKVETEPDFEMLSNPARVLPAQLKVLSWDKECRYHPLKPISVGGIIMLRDREAEKPEELIEPLKVVIPGQEEEEDEPRPPEPFEWTEN